MVMKVQKLIRTQNSKLQARILLAVIVLAGSVIPFLSLSQHADAAAFQRAYVRLDRLTATTATGGRVCVNPAAGATVETKLNVNFPTTAATSYVVNSTAANWTTTYAFETGFVATAMPITGNVASAVAGNVVTFDLTSNLTAGTLYCFNFAATNTLTTSSAGAAISGSNFGYVETRDATTAVVDKSFWGVTIVSAGTDVVVVTGQVVPYFTMALSANVDSWSAPLGTGIVNSSTGQTVTLNSNALNGWILWIKGTNFKTTGITETGTNPANRHGALTSATASGYAISNNTNNILATPSASHAFTAGVEDYGLGVTAIAQGTGAGTTSAHAVYDGATVGTAGVIDPTQYRPISSSTGTAVNATVTVKMVATVSTATPPATDYTDTIIYIGAGQF